LKNNKNIFDVKYLHALRGWSDKYLASKRKTKILEMWRFIYQHNLLVARYTCPSDAPTCLTHLKNTFSRGLQNRPLWRRRPPHSTQISVQRMTFSSLETKRSHTGPNLENMADGVAVRSPIRPIWPPRGPSVNRCVVMMEVHFILRQMGPYFLQCGGESAQ